MSRHSRFAPIALLIATTVLFPALSNAQSVTCTQALDLALAAAGTARAQDAVGNTRAALVANEQAKTDILNASPICNSVLTGQDLATYQQIISLANQYAADATLINQSNHASDAETFETQLTLSLQQAVNLAAGR